MQLREKNKESRRRKRKDEETHFNAWVKKLFYNFRSKPPTFISSSLLELHNCMTSDARVSISNLHFLSSNAMQVQPQSVYLFLCNWNVFRRSEGHLTSCILRNVLITHKISCFSHSLTPCLPWNAPCSPCFSSLIYHSHVVRFCVSYPWVFAVHGQWEEWSSWSLCSVTCGRGSRMRTRKCMDGGEAVACGRPEIQTKLCNIAVCPG